MQYLSHIPQYKIVAVSIIFNQDNFYLRIKLYGEKVKANCLERSNHTQHWFFRVNICNIAALESRPFHIYIGYCVIDIALKNILTSTATELPWLVAELYYRL